MIFTLYPSRVYSIYSACNHNKSINEKKKEKKEKNSKLTLYIMK